MFNTHSKKLVFTLSVLAIFFLNTCFAQHKPAVDFSAIQNWKTIGGTGVELISNDGRFFCYQLNHEFTGNTTMIIQRLSDSAVVEFPGATPAFFSKIENRLLFTMGDTVLSFNCNKWTKSKLAVTSAFSWSTSQWGEWIAWTDQDHQLTVTELLKNISWKTDHVTECTFEGGGALLLIKSQARWADPASTTLRKFDLSSKKFSTIWDNHAYTHHQLQGVSVDRSGKQIAFITRKDSGSTNKNVIWYFRDGMTGARILTEGSDGGISEDLTLAAGTPGFTAGGKYINFMLERKQVPVSDTISQVDVWNYRDRMLQSRQLKNKGPRQFAAVISTASSRIIQLESDSVILSTYPHMSTGDYIITRTNTGDRFWENEFSGANIHKYYLTSLRTGERSVMPIAGFGSFNFSPDGYHILYFDGTDLKSGYWSLDTRLQKYTCLTAGLAHGLFTQPDLLFERNAPANRPGGPYPFIGWLADGNKALVYDDRDVWLLDMTGKPLVCITNGYGKKHNIRFEVLGRKDGRIQYFNGKDKLLLAAFNERNCDNGFFLGQASRPVDPELLYMAPKTMYLSYERILPINAPCYDAGIEPLKAGNANLWIVKSNTATDAPNYFVSRDLRHFKRVTNEQPQAAYNWFTTERVAYMQVDSVPTHGIIYKPENFDPTRKYPVIIYFYQHFAHRVNQYMPPRLAMGSINIPWFVSRGYVVFTPDIHFTGGKMNASALASVVGGANYLSTLPYVDSTRIGINGHSMGGMMSNYIVTHSNRFACALSGAGVSDFFSASLSLGGIDNGSRLGPSEFRMGVPMAVSPETFINNSAIYNVGNVTTPLLLFHCMADAAVPFQQAVELFTVLRRLNKPVWLLQYDRGDHELNDLTDQKDYTNRVTQFYDHFLKGAPAPKWMTSGIPAYKKGVDKGY